jgi:hypothetical protein
MVKGSPIREAMARPVGTLNQRLYLPTLSGSGGHKFKRLRLKARLMADQSREVLAWEPTTAKDNTARATWLRAMQEIALRLSCSAQAQRTAANRARLLMVTN